MIIKNFSIIQAVSWQLTQDEAKNKILTTKEKLIFLSSWQHTKYHILKRLSKKTIDHQGKRNKFLKSN